MEDYKWITKEFYNKNAEKFGSKSKDYNVFISEHFPKDLELFLKNLKGKRILDLGSGPGRDAVLLKDKGLNPVCIDISPEMIKLCKEQGLEAYEMDIEDLKFKDREFDGIWAYTSLLNLPKNNLPKILEKIKDLLKKEGIFYLGMKEGNFEGLDIHKTFKEKRFISLYTDKELRELLNKDFIILHSSRKEFGTTPFINYLCRKK